MALTFDYKVRDRSGKLVEGQLEGDSMALVVRRLREMGYMPISVTPKSAVNLKTEIKIPGFSDRVKLREVAVVTRQLATMVDSGLSVVRSLGILAAQVENQAAGAGPRTRSARMSSAARRCPPRAPSTPRSSHISSSPWSRPARSAGTSTGALGPRRDDREAGSAEPDDPLGHDLPGRRAERDGRHLHGA